MKVTKAFLLFLAILFSTTIIYSQVNNNTIIKLVRLEDSSQNSTSRRLTSSDTLFVYELNDSTLFNLMRNSNYACHLVVIYVDWCGACADKIPILLTLIRKHEFMGTFFVFADQLKYEKPLSRFIVKNEMTFPTYILSREYKGNVKKRFIKFRNQICSDCDNNLGFPTLLLFNDRMEVVYKKTGDFSDFDAFMTAYRHRFQD